MILFRCDAGPEVGLGHLIRSVSLGIEISKITNCKPMFIINSSDKIISKYLDKKYFNIIRSSTKIGTDDDTKFINNYTKKEYLLIVDSRFVRQKDIDNWVKCCFLVGIDDDINKLNWPIILNYNLYAEKKNYHDLIGPRYNLINSNFFYKIKSNERSHRVLITMGGEDPVNLTSWIIKNGAEVLDRIDIRIIIGAAHPNIERVKLDAYKYLPKAEIIESPPNLVDHAIWSNFAITAGGMSAYELAASGNTLLGIALENHQIPLLSSMNKVGALEYLGEYKSITKAKLILSLRKLFDDSKKADRLRNSAQKLFPKPGSHLAATRIVDLWRGIFV
ncbi:MAG: hypothetical protein CFH01_00534 [Alphaproteobacteria bacterium MarineAlpha2_Bin1]|nr:MAG: hypothetical protein CFH01_00534 [Alphaproteobacteria bacterium MarineAlpha2_Bin1]|tara:strand:- start:394 stop:1392 length:999 start_codon:yes stop_codon:yes gene_type:complete